MQISNRLLISLSLAALPPSVHHSTGLSTILSSLEAELVPLSARVSAYAAGLPLLPAVSADSHADLPSLSHIDNCLRLLDAYLLGRWEDDYAIDGVAVLDNARKNGFGSTLLILCVSVDVVSRTHDVPFLVAAGPCFTLSNSKYSYSCIPFQHKSASNLHCEFWST